MNAPQNKAVRVFIRGRVQGVWFRAWTKEQADQLGLTGWVRNRRDGRVEALFAGPEDKLGLMLELCRSGPPAALVSAVKTEPAKGMAAKRFDIKSTV